MGYLGITVDGRAYRVKIVYDTYIDTFELVEGPNAGDMMSGLHRRDLRGTRAVYEMGIQPNPLYPDDFDDLYDLLRSPVDSHSVTVIDGQGTLTYDAQIQRGQRVYKGILSGRNIYEGGVIQFVPAKPQWRPSE